MKNELLELEQVVFVERSARQKYLQQQHQHLHQDGVDNAAFHNGADDVESRGSNVESDSVSLNKQFFSQSKREKWYRGLKSGSGPLYRILAKDCDIGVVQDGDCCHLAFSGIKDIAMAPGASKVLRNGDKIQSFTVNCAKFGPRINVETAKTMVELLLKNENAIVDIVSSAPHERSVDDNQVEIKMELEQQQQQQQQNQRQTEEDIEKDEAIGSSESSHQSANNRTRNNSNSDSDHAFQSIEHEDDGGQSHQVVEAKSDATTTGADVAVIGSSLEVLEVASSTTEPERVCFEMTRVSDSGESIELTQQHPAFLGSHEITKSIDIEDETEEDLAQSKTVVSTSLPEPSAEMLTQVADSASSSNSTSSSSSSDKEEEEDPSIIAQHHRSIISPTTNGIDAYIAL